ncbi:hypothetical protein HY792_05205 [Candidatus Desantisbacteria bacterium]|nr:hypothetical protein [Candidatus Desantisbacteria bacterium]
MVSNPVPPQACVWPGDTDNNGVVDERDIFPIAMNWGKTGAARHGNIRWKVQSVSIEGNDVCFLYADANGDGWVNMSDVLPIGMNWGKTHEVSVISYPPILHSEEIDHQTYYELYRAMYDTLTDTTPTDGVIQLKQALQGFMTAGNNQEITNIPAQSSLMQNYPNPFNPECWIPYELAEGTQVVIRI